MNLSPALTKAYTQEQLSAREAQRLAEVIAFGPMVFQASRIMVRWGILDLLRNAGSTGLTLDEIVRATSRPTYAIKVLVESSLSIGTLLIDPATDRFRLSKTGWFLLVDPATRINMAFNHDVNYEGLFHLEEALAEGRPAGLSHFGAWSTIYEGLSELPQQVQESWLAFDHFYSDSAFDEALKIVFDGGRTHRLLDVGGNTGRWALRCVNYDKTVRVTILDLPQQIDMMRKATADLPGADRIEGRGIDLLDKAAAFPADTAYDAIWMSQFLDCFGEEEIVGIVSRAARVMSPDTRLYIMETLWDCQKYEPATFCLTQTSLYFTAMANGNSKMYHSEDLTRCIERAGLTVECRNDNLGQGHSILICKLK